MRAGNFNFAGDMGHHHDHDNNSHLSIAFFLNLIFTIIEIIGGYYTNSLAILSDAVHDLGDSISLGLAWYFEKISDRPVDLKYTYGYKRFSVLGAIINGVILIIGSFFIIHAALPRILDPQPAHSTGMMILAIVGIIFNGLGYWKTHRGQSHNEHVVSLHLLEDVMGWVAVLIGAITMYFTGWYFIDPLLSIAIAIFILFNVIKNVKSTINIILQGTPELLDLDIIRALILNIELVEDVHDLHVWTMDGRHNILTAHIVAPANIDMSEANQLKSRIHIALSNAHVHHCTLEIERVGELCVLEH